MAARPTGTMLSWGSVVSFVRPAYVEWVFGRSSIEATAKLDNIPKMPRGYRTWNDYH